MKNHDNETSAPPLILEGEGDSKKTIEKIHENVEERESPNFGIKAREGFKKRAFG